MFSELYYREATKPVHNHEISIYWGENDFVEFTTCCMYVCPYEQRHHIEMSTSTTQVYFPLVVSLDPLALLCLCLLALPSSEYLLICPITPFDCNLGLLAGGSGNVFTISLSVSFHLPIAAFDASASIAWARRAA